jgi:hypothetical protein
VEDILDIVKLVWLFYSPTDNKIKLIYEIYTCM